MFIGHYSAAFAAKRIVPELPLPALFIGCQLIDLGWATLVLAGIEKLRVIPDFTASNGLDLYFMPYTHSLSSALLWSLTAAALFWIFGPRVAMRARASATVAMLVASHWILDLLVHVPDLPLWFDSMKVGLGWWNYRLFALLLELALLWASVLFFLPVAQVPRRCLLLATGMSAVQVASLYLQPAEGWKVAAQLLVTYLALTAAAFWATHAKRETAPAA